MSCSIGTPQSITGQMPSLTRPGMWGKLCVLSTQECKSENISAIQRRDRRQGLICQGEPWTGARVVDCEWAIGADYSRVEGAPTRTCKSMSCRTSVEYVASPSLNTPLTGTGAFSSRAEYESALVTVQRGFCVRTCWHAKAWFVLLRACHWWNRMPSQSSGHGRWPGWEYMCRAIPWNSWSCGRQEFSWHHLPNIAEFVPRPACKGRGVHKSQHWKPP